MKTNKLVTLMMIGVAALSLTGCGDSLEAKRQEDQEKTMEYWLEWSKEAKGALDTQEIYPGVNVMDIDLGGKTVAEATTLIQQELNAQILTNQVTLQYQDKEWKFTFEELGVSADAAAIAQRAFEIGRSGDLRQRDLLIRNLDTSKEAVQLDTAFDEKQLKTVLEELANEIKVEPVDAVLSFNDGTFSVTPEQNGLALDQEKAMADIQKALQDGQDGVKIELPVKEEKPKMTKELLSTIQDKIGSGSTYYSTSNYGREQNLIVGASKLNGMIVMPDEEVSFNSTVAPITAENGYHAANVIVGDEYVLDLGGGLCQVSTTLYNAVIRAELEVLERDCHAFPSDYVQMGLDAAVAQGYIDFRFKNTTGYPIYIAMWCGGGEIGAAIYGKETHDPSRTLSFDYEITSVIEKPKAVEEYDPTLKPGERVVKSEGHTGYTVDTYKTVTENGVSTTEWFSTSYYMASADKVKVGPKKTENPAPPATPAPTTPVPTTPEPTAPQPSTPAEPEDSEASGSTTPETPTPTPDPAAPENSTTGEEPAAQESTTTTEGQ